MILIKIILPILQCSYYINISVPDNDNDNDNEIVIFNIIMKVNIIMESLITIQTRMVLLGDNKIKVLH